MTIDLLDSPPAQQQETDEGLSNLAFSSGVAHQDALHYHSECLDQIYDFSKDIEMIFAEDPIEWKKKLTELFDQHTQALADRYDQTDDRGYNPEVADYLSRYIPLCQKSLEAFESPAALRAYGMGNAKPLVEEGLHLIHRISHALEAEMELYQERVVMKSKPLAELCREHPDRFRVLEDGSSLQVYSKWQDTWHDFPIPDTPNVWHKGGCSRVILKIVAGAPEPLIEEELPPNDFDAVTLEGDEAGYECCKRMGVDPDGIETISEMDMSKLGGSRDLNLNGSFFGRNAEGEVEFCYSVESEYAAGTGSIRVMLTDRPLYGADTYILQKKNFLRNRGMARLVKTLVAGQATNAELTRQDLETGLGIFWLVLAERFIKKDNAPVLLNRLYEVGKQLGQVQEGENDIYDVLQRVHQRYPFFELSKPSLDTLGTTRWLSNKLSQQFVRLFKQEFHKPSHELQMRRELDLSTVRIAMPPIRFQPGTAEAKRAGADAALLGRTHNEKWAIFHDEAKKRTRDLQEFESELISAETFDL